WHTPRAMVADDFACVRGAFAAAAQRAVRIGFDAIELHMAHGYLAHSFMSPISNERTDQYGGTLENRMRFPREIAEAVRHVVPPPIALGARITGSDWLDGGLTGAHAAVCAKNLHAPGFDLVGRTPGRRSSHPRPPPPPA